MDGRNPDLAEMLRELAFEVEEGEFPRLKEVRCDAKSGFPRDTIAIFADVGLDFGYEEWPVKEPGHKLRTWYQLLTQMTIMMIVGFDMCSSDG